MEIRDLAAIAPELMVAHPGHEWRLLSGEADGEDLVLVVHPVVAPDRIATVRVLPGVEVFSLHFAGHASTDFAYGDADRIEVLRERLELAAAATLGPTRVIVQRAGDRILGSTMVIDPDGPHPRVDSLVSWPPRRAWARIRLRRVVEHVVDFPRI